MATARRDGCPGCFGALSCRRRGATALPAAWSRSGGDGAARRLSRRPWRGATRWLWCSATPATAVPAVLAQRSCDGAAWRLSWLARGVAAVLACSRRGGFGAARRLSVRLWHDAMTIARRDGYPRGVRGARRRRRSATAVLAWSRRSGFGAVRRLSSLTVRSATSTARRDGRPRGLRNTRRRRRGPKTVPAACPLCGGGGEARRVGCLCGCRLSAVFFLLMSRSVIGDVYTIKTKLTNFNI